MRNILKSNFQFFLVVFYGHLISGCSPEYVKLNNRGYEKTKTGDYQGAMEDFNLSIKANENYWLAYANRASSYAMDGYYEKAIKDYNTSIALHKRNPLAYAGRGSCYATTGDTLKAISDYRNAIEYQYNNYLVYAYLGRMLVLTEHCDEAEFYLNKSIKKNVANDCISQKEIKELLEGCNE